MISKKRNERIIKDLQELDENGEYKYIYKEIANKYKLSLNIINNIARNYGIIRKPKIENKTNDLILKDLQELDENGEYKYIYKEIANKYKLSLNTINNIAKRNNIKRRILYKNNPIDNIDLENIIKDLQELDENGNYEYSYKEIANKYNLLHSQISYIARKYKITHKVESMRKKGR